jgi:hypothetical protein
MSTGDKHKKATAPPPFDPEEYARDASRRPTPKGLGAGGGPLPPVPPPRPPAPTLTNEEELEVARVRSMSLSERPTASSSASLLSLANANASVAGLPAPPSTRGDVGVAPSDPSEPGADAPHAATSPDPEAEMRDRFSLGDYSGALVIAEALLEDDPSHAEALRFAENCRSVLTQMYTARIGPLDRVPIVLIPRDQLRWLSIDHRAGFVLSHVDGVSSLEMILDVSGMPMLDVLRILYELVEQRVIAFR